MRIPSQPELHCETVSNQTEKQVMVAPDCKVEEAEGSGSPLSSSPGRSKYTYCSSTG